MSLLMGLKNSAFDGDWRESWPVADRLGLARYATEDSRRWLTITKNLLDQQKAANHVETLLEDLYRTLVNEGLNYAFEPFSQNSAVQRIRSIDTILNQKEATCIDLTLAFAGLCLAHGLLPVVVLVKGHVFLVVSLKWRIKTWDRRPEARELSGQDGLVPNATKLLTLVQSGEYLALECTGCASSEALRTIPEPKPPEAESRDKSPCMTFPNAVVAGTKQLKLALEPSSARPFLFAVDIASAHNRHKITPYRIPGTPWTRKIRRYWIRLTLALVTMVFVTGCLLAWIAHHKSIRDQADGLVRDLAASETTPGQIKSRIASAEQSVQIALPTSLRNSLNRKLNSTTNLLEARSQGFARAKTAIALALTGDLMPMLELLRHDESFDNPDLNAYLTWMLPSSGIDAPILALKAETSDCPRIRQQLLLVLGRMEPAARGGIDLEELAGRLLEADDDPGVHAASYWILKKLNTS